MRANSQNVEDIENGLKNWLEATAPPAVTTVVDSLVKRSTAVSAYAVSAAALLITAAPTLLDDVKQSSLSTLLRVLIYFSTVAYLIAIILALTFVNYISYLPVSARRILLDQKSKPTLREHSKFFYKNDTTTRSRSEFEAMEVFGLKPRVYRMWVALWYAIYSGSVAFIAIMILFLWLKEDAWVSVILAFFAFVLGAGLVWVISA
ncbi:hypothetical protein M408DRAFT_24117 [Serendipita vermifera MAFF 305830]|uniref:Uncharacterized protein n=1 Tax=Serendipita vermifera MAFF 305830 TaxID=933852 RepID=A0A0C2WPH6_SERVB|nr:hypothetical protein M408DRAFT_24117 [Serendipita vermifera MAFF 305830]